MSIKLIALPFLAILLYVFWITFSAASETPQVGTMAPDFSLPDQDGKQIALADFHGKWVVLYFYPKDDTPGCTKEACSFRDDLHQLTALGAQIIGISLDDGDSHTKFVQKYHLPFPLLSDKSGIVASQYGALVNLGIVKFAKRYTFLIQPDGKITKAYLAVDTARHSQEIIQDLQNIQKVIK